MPIHQTKKDSQSQRHFANWESLLLIFLNHRLCLCANETCRVVSEKNSNRYNRRWPSNQLLLTRGVLLMSSDNSLSHTRWNCKYHIVFIPKYRRKVVYGKLRKDIGAILRKLCEMKDVEILEAHAMPDHIHMLVKIPPKMSVSYFMGYLKGKSSLMIHDRHANLKYNHGNRTFWAKGYYVSTVGLNEKTIAKYIREQEAEDRLRDNMSKREYVDPFKEK